MSLAQLLRPLRLRMAAMISRAAVLLTDDSEGFQLVQVRMRGGQVRGQVERIEEYGFTSRPFPDAEAVVVHLGAEPDHAVIIATGDRRHRMRNLEEGEVCIHTDEGDTIWLRRGKHIEVISGGSVTVNAPEITITGNVTIDGDLSVTGEVIDKSESGGQSMSAMRGVYNSHVHSENDSGGPTDPPNNPMG